MWSLKLQTRAGVVRETDQEAFPCKCPASASGTARAGSVSDTVFWALEVGWQLLAILSSLYCIVASVTIAKTVIDVFVNALGTCT